MSKKRITGLAFRKARTKAGATVADVARAWGVDRITVHEWESGRKPVPYERGAAIIAASKGGAL